MLAPSAENARHFTSITTPAGPLICASNGSNWTLGRAKTSDVLASSLKPISIEAAVPVSALSIHSVETNSALREPDTFISPSGMSPRRPPPPTTY